LSEEERAVIERRARSSNAPFRQVMRARIVMYLTEELDNSLIAGRPFIRERVAKRFSRNG
jgi:hypothetical protein